MTPLLDAGLWLLRRLPLGLASAIGWLVAAVWWTLLPVRRRVAVENLRRALPEASPRAVLTRMMHDLVLGFVEAVQFERLHIVVEGVEGVSGAVILGGHAGNWEATLYALAERTPTAIFLRTPSHPWVRARMSELRAAHRVHALETGATLNDAWAAFDSGRSVLFVQDQRHRRGILSPFFGRDCATSTGFATAVLRTGRPVYGLWQWREGVGRHRVRLEPLAVSGDVQALTDAANRWYEAQIRARPHGWLWLHRRWS